MLMPKIVEAGYALENMASLPHINMVGAYVTSTHGSGHKYQILSNIVTEFDIIFPNGSFKTLKKADIGETEFFRMIHSFGGIGVITGMTIKLAPNFMVHKAMYTNLQWDTLFDPANFDRIMHNQDFLSFFTIWQERVMTSVWTGKVYLPNE